MKHTVEFGGPGPQDVTARTSGPASAEGFLALVRAIVGDERFRPGARVLVDHTAIDPTPLTGADMREVADALERLDAVIGESAAAIVAPTALMFGFARMFESYVDRTRLRVAIFGSVPEASAWLAELPGGGPAS
jgi:hypothetical protein